MHPELLGRMVSLEHSARIHAASAKAAGACEGTDDAAHETRHVGRLARVFAFATTRRAPAPRTEPGQISTAGAAVAAG